jgi:hypothetical protein
VVKHFPNPTEKTDIPPEPGIPAGNRRAVKITPDYTFYTTPLRPYRIEYKVVIEQKTRYEPLTPADGEGDFRVTGNGLLVHTVLDGTKNPWDMDPTQNGRQTKGTWTFGIRPNASPPPAVQMSNFDAKYEPRP